VRHGIEHAIAKQLGVCEEQRRVPAEQHEARHAPCVWITRHVVVALHVVYAPEHRRMRPPAVPQELEHRDGDGEADALDRAERDDAEEARHRQPELPPLYPIDAPQIGELEHLDRRRNHHRRERRHRQVCEQVGANTSNSAIEIAPTTPVSCDFEPAATATGVRDALLLTGNPWRKPVARFTAPSRHLLVRIDAQTETRRVGAREHAGIGKRDERHRYAAQQHRHHVVGADQRQLRHRQSARHGAEHRDTRGPAEIENPDHDRGATDRNQRSGNVRIALQRDEHCKTHRADRNAGHVGAARERLLQRRRRGMEQDLTTPRGYRAIAATDSA
jgi:hypothetical protein